MIMRFLKQFLLVSESYYAMKQMSLCEIWIDINAYSVYNQVPLKPKDLNFH